MDDFGYGYDGGSYDSGGGYSYGGGCDSGGGWGVASYDNANYDSYSSYTGDFAAQYSTADFPQEQSYSAAPVVGSWVDPGVEQLSAAVAGICLEGWDEPASTAGLDSSLTGWDDSPGDSVAGPSGWGDDPASTVGQDSGWDDDPQCTLSPGWDELPTGASGWEGTPGDSVIGPSGWDDDSASTVGQELLGASGREDDPQCTLPSDWDEPPTGASGWDDTPGDSVAGPSGWGDDTASTVGQESGWDGDPQCTLPSDWDEPPTGASGWDNEVQPISSTPGWGDSDPMSTTSQSGWGDSGQASAASGGWNDDQQCPPPSGWYEPLTSFTGEGGEGSPIDAFSEGSAPSGGNERAGEESPIDYTFLDRGNPSASSAPTSSGVISGHEPYGGGERAGEENPIDYLSLGGGGIPCVSFPPTRWENSSARTVPSWGPAPKVLLRIRVVSSGAPKANCNVQVFYKNSQGRWTTPGIATSGPDGYVDIFIPPLEKRGGADGLGIYVHTGWISDKSCYKFAVDNAGGNFTVAYRGIQPGWENERCEHMN